MNDAPDSNSEWWGVLFPSAGQLRISELTINLADDGSGGGSAKPEVRLDVWPHWLSIARDARDQAAAARATNPAADIPAFGEALQREMLHSMTCMCAVAFALEAFTNSVLHHQPHVLPPAPVPGSRNRGTSADGRIHQVWMRAFRATNEQAKQIRTPLQQIFRFRDQAVHPAVAFVAPTRHPTFPVSVHPRFAIFRTDNADTAIRFADEALRFLLANPRGKDAGWLEWCTFMTTHVWPKAESPPPTDAPPDSPPRPE